MSDIVIDLEKRDIKEKNVRLRKNGIIPAIIYGHNKENILVKLNEKTFSRALKGNYASNIFIDLNIDKEGASKTVYIKEVQKHVITTHIQHIDFVEINPDEKLHIEVPVKLSGVSIGITEGGLQDFVLRSIEISCLPKDTPKEIKVDITNLHIGESIHVNDIDLGENVKITTTKDATIVSIVEPEKEKKVEEEADAVAEAPTPAASSETADKKK